MRNNAFSYPPSTRRIGLGFTLIELLVVIGIVAILASIAAPSFRGLIVKNSIDSVASALRSDLNFARSEALKRGISMTACVSSSTTDCADSGSWENGWIIFVDRDANNSRSTTAADGEDLVRIYQPGDSSPFRFFSTSGTEVKTLRFDRSGTTSARGLKITPNDTSLEVGRALCLSTSGRVRVTEVGVESC